MEVVKRKILLENSIDRTFNSPTWGIITATTFYINIMITQNMDDMGLFTDIAYISGSTSSSSQPDYTILKDKLNTSGFTFPFMVGITPGTMTGITGTTQVVLRLPSQTEASWYDYGNLVVTGYTDTKIQDLKSYDANNPYIAGFDMDKTVFIDYLGTTISGVSRVVSLGEPKTYAFDAIADTNIGTMSQLHGIAYQEYSGRTRNINIDSKKTTIAQTSFNYIGEGWNETNTSLSALTKEEYLFGIIYPPEVQSDVFIDRGTTTVMDRHLRLSEIKNLGELIRYGNGFYNLTKQ